MLTAESQRRRGIKNSMSLRLPASAVKMANSTALIHHSPFAPRFLLQHNSKRSSLTRFGGFYKQLPLVVLFNNAFAKAQSQSPASFFGGETRFKHFADVLFGNALARIGYIDESFVVLLPYVQGDHAFSFHGIQRIF